MTVSKGQPNFIPLRDALKSENWGEVGNHVNASTSLQAWSKGAFKVEGKVITHDGEALPQGIAQRIFSMVERNESPEAYFNFVGRLNANPSRRSVTQLWPFMEHKGIPLTLKGTFLAYKSVREDFKDHHSGTVDNSPGSICEMPRNKISDDPREACHVGFHVGAMDYVKSFGSGRKRIVVCEVDPADVVCIPYDSSQQKMRVCKYVVVGIHREGELMPDTVMDLSGENGTSITHESEDTVHPVVPRSKKWVEWDKKDIVELMSESPPQLRAYASKGLNIVGVANIPGGKINLVQAILQARYEEGGE